MQGIEFSGVFVVRDFISQDEESRLVSTIDETPWMVSQSGRRKQVGESCFALIIIRVIHDSLQDYGPKPNFKRQKVKIGAFTGALNILLPCQDLIDMNDVLTGLPSFAQLLLDRIHTIPESKVHASLRFRKKTKLIFLVCFMAGLCCCGAM